jgi:hypothetical protein
MIGQYTKVEIGQSGEDKAHKAKRDRTQAAANFLS